MARRGHVAGSRLGGRDPEARYFRRLTDIRVREALSKAPLEVGANLIARTAFAALELLEALRRELDVSIDLRWKPGALGASRGAIEVYPAATFLAHGASPGRYKSADRKTRGPARSKLVDLLDRKIDGVGAHRAAMMASDHVLDAVACVLAAQDFLEGDVLLCARRGVLLTRDGASTLFSTAPSYVGIPSRVVHAR